MGLIASKEELFTAARLKTVAVDIAEDRQMLVSELCAVDGAQLMLDSSLKNESGNYAMTRLGPALLVRCLVNEAGERLFADDETDQLRRINSDAYGKLLAEALRINGLSQGAQEELEKNSEPSPSA
jgi:hypothetical protein